MPGIGGALVLGAVPRLRRAGLHKVRQSILLGLGIVLLMNTRPFEGLVLTAAALVYLALGASHAAWAQIAVPAALILGAGLVFTGYYNWRVTGSPSECPTK